MPLDYEQLGTPPINPNDPGFGTRPIGETFEQCRDKAFRDAKACRDSSDMSDEALRKCNQQFQADINNCRTRFGKVPHQFPKFSICEDCSWTNMGACLACVGESLQDWIAYLSVNVLAVGAILFGLYLLFRTEANEAINKAGKVAALAA